MRWLASNQTTTFPSSHPPSRPTSNRVPKAKRTDSRAISPFPATAHLKIRTARMAPIGSTTIPSHRKIEEILRLGFMSRSRGAITVGPVTVRIDPMTAAIRHSYPSTKAMKTVERMPETITATVQSLNTATRPSLSSPSRSVRPPSNRMIATNSPTTDNSGLPSPS